MKQSIRTLQDIAYNIGYIDGLVRVSQLRGLSIAYLHATKEFARLVTEWELAKNNYLKQYGDTQCPVMKQLIKVLLEDRTKHFNLGLKACSENFSQSESI